MKSSGEAFIICKGKECLQTLWINSYGGADFMRTGSALNETHRLRIAYDSYEDAEKALKSLPPLKKFNSLIIRKIRYGWEFL